MNKGSYQDSVVMTRLRTMLDDIKSHETQGLYEELTDIVLEHANRVLDHKAFADALDVAFRALLDAEGGLIKKVAPLMRFDLTKLMRHATIKKAAVEVGIGQAIHQDKIKAFIRGLPKHTHVETIGDPDVANIVLAAVKGIPGRTPRGNPLDQKVKKLHLEYRAQAPKPKRVRTDSP